jgi:phosphate transport system protein
MEIETEEECLHTLALHQPVAFDLRFVVAVLKMNNDLERIADLAAGMGRRVKHVVADGVALEQYDEFEHLTQATLDILGKTVRILSNSDTSVAKTVIAMDALIDKGYAHVVERVLNSEGRRIGGAGAAMTVVNLAKAMERIGDLCTNIAEDIIFLRTGDIVRHPEAFHQAESPQ